MCPLDICVRRTDWDRLVDRREGVPVAMTSDAL